MRWSLRRPRRLAQPHSAAAPSRRGPRDWVALPPLPTTVALPPPILHDGFLALPPVGGARPLLRPEMISRTPRPNRMTQATQATRGNGAKQDAPHARPVRELSPDPDLTHRPAPDLGPVASTGTVASTGPVASPESVVGAGAGAAASPGGVPEPGAPSGRGAAGDQPAAGSAAGPAPRPQVLPVRSVPVVSRPSRTRRQLTQATDDYVGEPREPADPYRSSAWLRMVSAMQPPWAVDADDDTAPKPLPPSPRRPAPKLVSGPRQAPSADRASLARSRRLGLGRPTSQPAQQQPAQQQPAQQQPAQQWPTQQRAEPPAAAGTQSALQPEQPTGGSASGSAGPAARSAARPERPAGQPEGPDRASGPAGIPGGSARTAAAQAARGPESPTEPAPAPGALVYRAAATSPSGEDRPRPNRRTGTVSSPEARGADASHATVVRPPATTPPATTVPPSAPAAPPRPASPRPARPLGLAMPTSATPPASGIPAGRPGRPRPARTPAAPADSTAAHSGRPTPPHTTPSPGASAALPGRPTPRRPSGPPADRTEPAPRPPQDAVPPGAALAAPELTVADPATQAPPDLTTPLPQVTLVSPELSVPPPRTRAVPPRTRAVAPHPPLDGEPATGTAASPRPTAAARPPGSAAGLAARRLRAPDRAPGALPTRSVYRSVLPPLPPAPARRAEHGPAVLPQAVPPQAVLPQAVPGDIASMFRSLHGVDVSDVPVHRGHVATEHARDLGARAFASGQEVYLPDAAGSLDHRQARALLAHELTHAAHQRRLGAALPDESSAAGQVLEAQAVATERWFLGGQGPDLPVTSLAAAAGSASPGFAMPPRPRLIDDGPLPPLRSRPFPPLPHVQRQPAGATSGTAAVGTAALSAATVAEMAASGAARLKSLARERATWSAPAWLGAGAATAPRNTAPGNTMFGETVLGETVPADTVPADTVTPETAAAETTAAATEAMVARTRGELAELREQLTTLAGQRPVGLDDPIALDELATRLYQRLRSRMRLELIVDRERAGLLTDFR